MGVSADGVPKQEKEKNDEGTLVILLKITKIFLSTNIRYSTQNSN